MARRSQSRRRRSRSRSRGWGRAAPRTMTERKALAKRCGLKKCFLRPSNLGFPICSYRGSCKPDCRGLAAARSRARQFGYASIVRKARSMRKSCPKSGGRPRRSRSRRRSRKRRSRKRRSRKRRSKSRRR